jgi:hypothetical protein
MFGLPLPNLMRWPYVRISFAPPPSKPENPLRLFHAHPKGHGWRGFQRMSLDCRHWQLRRFGPFSAPFSSLLSVDALTVKASGSCKNKGLRECGWSGGLVGGWGLKIGIRTSFAVDIGCKLFNDASFCG